MSIILDVISLFNHTIAYRLLLVLRFPALTLSAARDKKLPPKVDNILFNKTICTN